ncbi:MAG: radical SAM family heme chaperone HemW, partial [Mediterranea sp.]|nr:radical SAM family heme chaperone HemW [Mediterranea sp.]
EANPDDLTEEYVAMLRTLPFNRISIGIQTFNDEMLQLLGRRHTARQAIEAVERCRRKGFNNLSIDLMYGLPGETDRQWNADLQQALSLNAEHLSAYHLTYEKDTPLYRMTHLPRVDEESSVRFFTTLIDTLAAGGYEHYEISNFCKPGFHSRHNSAYWQGVPYLGCGASAHSFDGTSRRWNIASLDRYITGIEQRHPYYETEQLDLSTRYNEYIMTGLRTKPGIRTAEIEARFGTSLRSYCQKQAAPYIESGKLSFTGGQLSLTREGIFVSDGIISDLMFVE